MFHAPTTRTNTQIAASALLLRRLPATRPALVRAAEEGARRAQQDLQVDERRPVLDVPEVELDPLGPGEPRPAVDLRPARDARPDVEPVALHRGGLSPRVRLGWRPGARVSASELTRARPGGLGGRGPRHTGVAVMVDGHS